MQKPLLVKQATQHIDQKINQHLQWLTKISSLIKNALDPRLQPHIWVANVNQNRLILQTTSGAWATALRYRIPELLEKLHKYPELRHINKIESIIKPESIVKTPKTAAMSTLSKSTADSLHSMADTITDEKLSGILHKIANNCDNIN